ncbi:sulfotransferase family protein [Pseudomonas sp. NPDC087803]|uniref:sulfotransferase family protein n=1 Tax=Pseudomonas sp. NPDC087803 TaxID=3364448 RepID=UPI003806EF3D
MYDLVLIAGPCRSGTTFVFNALSHGDFTGVFQPLKHQIRCALSGHSSEMKLEQYAGHRVVVKEAFGPYRLEEADYDPVQKTIELFQAEKVLLVLVLRSPQECLASWEKAFHSDSPVSDQVFNQAYLNTLRLQQKYAGQVDVETLILEQQQHFTRTLEDIRTRIGASDPGQGYRNYVKHRDPPGYEVHGLLDKALKGKDYNAAYVSTDKATVDVSRIALALQCYGEATRNLKLPSESHHGF